jgi:thiol-disulfide isomerase/thioredoxin
MNFQKAIKYVRNNGNEVEQARLNHILTNERASEEVRAKLFARQRLDGGYSAHWKFQKGESIMKISAVSFVIVFLIVMLSCAPIGRSIPPTTSVVTDAPYDENAVPGEDIANALAESEKDGKLVLLDFGANWCPDCVVLSKLFEDPTVTPFLEENFHVVSIDVGYWDKNLDISEKYGNPIKNGIPAVVVLAPNGEIIASTKDGALANARTATAQDILAYLQIWVAQKP